MNQPLSSSPAIGGENFSADIGGESAFIGSYRKRILSPDEKAAIVLYVLGPVRAATVFEKLNDKDHRQFAKALHRLGFVEANVIEETLAEYLSCLRQDGPIRGGSNEARRFLHNILPKDMVDQIMEEVEGKFDANIWDRVSNAPEGMLAHYLRGEQMQTVAVILSRIRAEKAAKVLDLLPEEKSRGIVIQMSRLGSIDRSVLENVQQALRQDFLTLLMKQSSARKPSDIIASILNNIPGSKAGDILDNLRDADQEIADVIQRSMFTFEDFALRLDGLSIQKVIKEVPNETLVKALKMAQQKQPESYEFFLSNMSKRASEAIKEEIEGFGALRMRDAETAQQEVIQITRDLAKSGIIEILEADHGDQGGAGTL